MQSYRINNNDLTNAYYEALSNILRIFFEDKQRGNELLLLYLSIINSYIKRISKTEEEELMKILDSIKEFFIKEDKQKKMMI